MVLGPREREQLVSNICTVVREVFVHRRMKTAIHGFDVMPLLDSLRRRAPVLPDSELHSELRRVINGLRDRHTRYQYTSNEPSYSLPFTIERAFENGRSNYIVSRSDVSEVQPEAVVLRWNGSPVDAVLREFAEEIGASNDAARRALALRFLTDRPSDRFDAPPEGTVTIDLRLTDGSEKSTSLAWDEATQAFAHLSTPAAVQVGQGVDFDLLRSNRRLLETFSEKFDDLAGTSYPNVQARVVQHEGKDYGYLRIFDFGVDDADDFAAFVSRVVRPLPSNGLIIDLRGNPGGYIRAGELLLQLFTQERIYPSGFRFRASDAVDHLVSTSDYFDDWELTIRQGARLAEEHSGTFPIEGNEESFNNLGQVYFGPTLLIVDALTFSTADIFTAGFIDHNIGPVVCTDDNISAGGANNWQYDLLRALMPGFLIPRSAEAELGAGKPGPIIVAAFSDAGIVISETSTISPIPNWPFGDLWQILDDTVSYKVARSDWVRQELAVYHSGDNRFIGDLPPGVRFGFSIRQAVRRRSAQGLVLEDEGIAADHYYQMTTKDVLYGNEDLITYACDLLSK